MNIEVAIVGNGYSAGIGNCGELIDSAKTVVRFNCFTTLGYQQHVGSKLDVWVCNSSRNDTIPLLRSLVGNTTHQPSKFLIFMDFDLLQRVIRDAYPDTTIEFADTN